MNSVALSVALLTAVEPLPGPLRATAAPESAPKDRAEGPLAAPAAAPLPTTDERRRDRELRGATIGFGIASGIAGVVAITATAVAAHRRGECGCADEEARITQAAAWTMTGFSLAALTTVAVMRRRLRGPKRPPPLRWHPWEHPEVMRGEINPALVPAWVARDRRLTRGILASAGVSGAGVLGMILAGVIGNQRQGTFEGNLGQLWAYVSLGTLTGVGLVSLASLGLARAIHRRPLERWNANLTRGGFQLRF